MIGQIEAELYLQSMECTGSLYDVSALCRHVQRVTPVDGLCLPVEASIRQLVASLAKIFVSTSPACEHLKKKEAIGQGKLASSPAAPDPSASASEHLEKDAKAQDKAEPCSAALQSRASACGQLERKANGQDKTEPYSAGPEGVLPFAVAFKSRSGNPENKQQAGVSSISAVKQNPEQAMAGNGPPEAPDSSHTYGDAAKNDGPQKRAASASLGSAATSADNSSAKEPDEAPGMLHTCKGSKAQVVLWGAKEAEALLDANMQTRPAAPCISRGAATAAAAESFSSACHDAGVKAVVSLKQAQALVCLDILPVGVSAIAGVSIMDSSACVLTPKLALKPLHGGRCQ